MAKKKTGYIPPFTITSKTVHLVSEISETLGRFSSSNLADMTPMLRRGNRLRTIQASLAIENNTLTLEQVTAIINGKKVLGSPREIQEVKNAFATYEMFEKLNPLSEKDLLKAHKILMSALVDEEGRYRSGGVGIVKGKRIVHLAPPAVRVPALVRDLFAWLKGTDAHPLITSSVFHYEFEFIHPFADENGRMGRLWQTLILSRWKPILAYLPVETVIRNRQDEYYKVLATSDQHADSTAFVEFMLAAINEALYEAIETDQVSDQVSDQVKKILQILVKGPLSALDLMKALNLSHRPTFRKNYLHPAINKGFIEMTIPDKPNSRIQQYRITSKGISVIKEQK
ncbi:MAG: Fic family protein [Desulfobacterium sp.]|nr:Fic family protein [Desulfobacterium sp.]MBU3950097.1 Fic family protein [Pseudomonadota bacterium]MBU4011345.1 Fic family protein [Pseudomonadota bacterium]MBU4034865.1 Fic family protein [Pseudomonadota bacterium]